VTSRQDRPEDALRLRVLDLFAGLQGWASAFLDAGHHVVSLDIDPSFSTTLIADVLAVTVDQLGGRDAYDVVLASPPCEGFSVGSIGRHWTLEKRGGVATPKSDGARLGVALAHRTAQLIRDLAPRRGFVIENPTGMMRHVFGFVGPTTVEGLTVERWLHPADRPRSGRAPSVTYCALGMHYRKPTDLWVGGPLVDLLTLPAPCRPKKAAPVDVDGVPYRVNAWTDQPCHEVAERGARTGVQGLESYAERSLVPTDLSNRVRLAAEAVDVDPVGRDPELDPALRGYAQGSLL
jgi:hypothetical protein